MNNPWLKKKTFAVQLMDVDRPLEMTKRLYPRAVIERCIKDLQATISDRGLMGHLDHQTDSVIRLAQVSHLITGLWFMGDQLCAGIEIMDTHNGRVLDMLIQEHPQDVVFATAGVGNGRVNDNGILVVNDNYKLITVNAVPKDGGGEFKSYPREYLLQE